MTQEEGRAAGILPPKQKSKDKYSKEEGAALLKGQILAQRKLNEIEIIWDGEPIAKQSVKKGKRNGKEVWYNPKNKFKPAMIREAKTQVPLGFELWDCPIELIATFVFSPLKGWSAKKLKELSEGKEFPKATKPDNDNLLKLPKDVLEGIVYINDSRIWRTTVKKIYGLEPKTIFYLKKTI